MSKFMLQRTQELSRTHHEDGKQGAWNGHAQDSVASKGSARRVSGQTPNAKKINEMKEEFRTAQQQVNKTTLGRGALDHQRVRV